MRTIGQKMSKLKAIRDNILCINGDFGAKKTRAGIIVKATIGTDEGVTPRWFEVFEVGPDIDWLKPGQWVYVSYGRWTEGFKTTDERLDPDQKVWKVDPEGCMLVSDEGPTDTLNIGNFTTTRPDQV